MGEITGPITQEQLVSAASEGHIDRDTSVRKGEDGAWKMANDVRGLFPDLAETYEAMGRNKLAMRDAEERDRKRWEDMTVSTCAPPAKYDFKIIDTVFAVDGDSGKAGGFFSYGKSADPNAAFDKVKEQLRSTAYKLGGDGVINCQFEYRIAVTSTGNNARQAIEIFANGTAVKFV